MISQNRTHTHTQTQTKKGKNVKKKVKKYFGNIVNGNLNKLHKANDVNATDAVNVLPAAVYVMKDDIITNIGATPQNIVIPAIQLKYVFNTPNSSSFKIPFFIFYFLFFIFLIFFIYLFFIAYLLIFSLTLFVIAGMDSLSQSLKFSFFFDKHFQKGPTNIYKYIQAIFLRNKKK